MDQDKLNKIKKIYIGLGKVEEGIKIGNAKRQVHL